MYAVSSAKRDAGRCCRFGHAISEVPVCSPSGTGSTVVGAGGSLGFPFGGLVVAVGPALLFLASRLKTGQEALLAGCGPPQLAQVAGISLGRLHSLAACASPHLTHAIWR
ncbi:unnamed protein product [Colias eurytheme]|nr:unnamed protein product [Colias eurytheme]